MTMWGLPSVKRIAIYFFLKLQLLDACADLLPREPVEHHQPCVVAACLPEIVLSVPKKYQRTSTQQASGTPNPKPHPKQATKHDRPIRVLYIRGPLLILLALYQPVESSFRTAIACVAMAPSFKISFPLPRRPSGSPSTATPGSQYSNNSNHDDSPLLHPGSKAERTLGASEPGRPDQKRKQSRKEKRQLRKNPSFMSVTLSDVDGETPPPSDGFPFPGMETPTEQGRRPTPCPDRQGSSPLLGQLYAGPSTTGEGQLSTVTAPQARRVGSSSTLRSHYDPVKVPLPISQQTSDSSSRDMALRKGLPPISSPTESRRTDGIDSTEPEKKHSRSISENSKTSKLSGNSVKRVDGRPRRRPSITDPPTLYPYTDRAFIAVSPPPALITSSLPKSLHPNSSLGKSKWWQRKTPSPQTSPPIPSEDQQDRDTFEEHFSSLKVNIKKPKLGVTGARNWFDGLEDEDQDLEHPLYPEILQQPSQEKSDHPSSIYEIMAQDSRSSQISRRKSSFSNKSQRTGASDRKLSFRIDPSPLNSPSSPLNVSKSTPSSPQALSIQSRTNSKVPRAALDLQVESFLELSSSEDESGEGDVTTEAVEVYSRHPTRVSIEPSSHNKRVSIVNAQHAQSTRPRSINRTSSRPLSKRSISSENVPPVPKIPSQPKLGQRTSSMRWREMMDEKAASTESTVDSGASSFNDDASVGRVQSSRTQKKLSVRGSKLMKVTSEEERLLEAMRQKRASIRQDDFENGFKTAMQLQDIVVRPKTAGADGRNSRMSVYGFRCSNSPPLQDFGFGRQLANPRLSASADALLLEDSYPFPKVPLSEARNGYLSRERVPPNLKTPTGLASPPKSSPSLSFGPSDILPSTPTSRSSPLTPPPGHGSLGIFGRNSTLSPPRTITAMNKLGHDRKRTTSSSVVMLDGVEQHAQELDEENEITGWAMDRW